MQNIDFEFDPLKNTDNADSEILNAAKKREIRNILKSYVGIFDSFAELIQNSMDSVDKKKRLSDTAFDKKLWLEINLLENSFTIIDNGIGFNRKEFEAFLAPNISFKDGNKTRGNKGVGATYIAYGFNYLELSTKNSDFRYSGKISQGREWVEDNESLVTRPVVKALHIKRPIFDELESGAMFTIKYGGEYTRPKSLTYFNASNADQWLFLLLLKTPLGCIDLFNKHDSRINFSLTVIDMENNKTEITNQNADYIYPHTKITASADIKEISRIQHQLLERGRDSSKLPPQYSRLNGLYGFFSTEELKGLPTNRMEESHLQLINEYQIEAYGYFGYSTSIWDEFSDNLAKLRKGYRVLKGGLLIANNGMIQGEYLSIPLTSNIGYQNQAHIIVHLTNADPDLGRKGFQPELRELAEIISVAILNRLKQWRHQLRNDTGAKPQITTQIKLHSWIREQELHEEKFPINLTNPNFFMPINEISITSVPVSEQDVIVLFNQLIAGGVIRGLKLLSTSQYATYDGLFKYYINEPVKNHIFDKKTNPLGVQELGIAPGTYSNPHVLEYKFCLDALFQEFENGEKNEKDIHLAVAWELGESWKKNYNITSLLDLHNLHHRQFHGVTHIINSSTTSFNLILLKELIDYLNDVDSVQPIQKQTYGEDLFFG